MMVSLAIAVSSLEATKGMLSSHVGFSSRHFQSLGDFWTRLSVPAGLASHNQLFTHLLVVGLYEGVCDFFTSVQRGDEDEQGAARY